MLIKWINLVVQWTFYSFVDKRNKLVDKNWGLVDTFLDSVDTLVDKHKNFVDTLKFSGKIKMTLNNKKDKVE